MKPFFVDSRDIYGYQCTQHHRLFNRSENEFQSNTGSYGTYISQWSEELGEFEYNMKDCETPLYGVKYEKCEPLAILDGPWDEHSFVKPVCENESGTCLVSWTQ